MSQPQRDWGSIFGGAFIAVISLVGLYGCYHQDNTRPSPAPVSDYQWDRLQDSWDSQDVENQVNLCASWTESRDMATDLFYEMAAQNDVQDVPDRTTVQAFFDSKCN